MANWDQSGHYDHPDLGHTSLPIFHQHLWLGALYGQEGPWAWGMLGAIPQGSGLQYVTHRRILLDTPDHSNCPLQLHFPGTVMHRVREFFSRIFWINLYEGLFHHWRHLLIQTTICVF